MSDGGSTLTEQIFGKKAEEFLWQDREIRFDLPPVDLQCRRGENVLHTLTPVEDTKGNDGEQGTLLITNLRLIWSAKRNSRTNISVGHNCISTVSVKPAESRLRGSAQALYLLSRFNGQRFEFIFTGGSESTPQIFAPISRVHAAYESSRLYRDLKLRGALIQDKELRLLPQEQCYSKVNGVWNLSSEHGNLGTFFITNVRVVWHSNLAEGFNVSIPHLQLKTVRLRESKFGPALVLETMQRAGGYVLGFKIDPKEALEHVHKEIHSLWQVYSQCPIFGVEFDPNNMDVPEQQEGVAPGEEDVQILDADSRMDTWAACYATGGSSTGREPVFCPELGLAMEALPEGTTVEALWNIVAAA